MYRRILEVLARAPGLTIGQLAKRMDVDTLELRGYLAWMRRVGKVSSVGRARATRYSLPEGVVAEG
jgi:DNA-binding IclR family transcriptional regulator